MSQLGTSLFRLKGHVQHALKTNSPAILTALGVSGTITTVYLVGRASFEACRVIDHAEVVRANANGLHSPDPPPPLNVREKTELVWKLYLPSAASGTMTIACIILASRASSKRTAAITAAYSLSEKAFVEYREKVSEAFGERKERAIRDSIAQDRVEKYPPSEGQLILAVPGNVLCFEQLTGRYFHSDMETLRRAENKINAKIFRELYVTLNQFYDEVGLEHTSQGDELGWDSEKGLLELIFSATLSKDDVPCIAIEYNYKKIL